MGKVERIGTINCSRIMTKSFIASSIAFSLIFNVSFAQEADPFDDLLPSDDFGITAESDDIFADVNSGGVVVENPGAFVDVAPGNVIVETQNSSATGLPGSASKTLSVTNISMDNADALSSGARAGDVLRYSFKIQSQTEGVNNFVPRFDVSGLMGKVDFTELGLGQLNGNQLVFPAYSNKAPCEQEFTFFVQVKDCSQISTKSLSTSIEGRNANLNVSCGLTPTGPSQYLMYGSVLAIIMLMVFFFTSRRRSV